MNKLLTLNGGGIIVNQNGQNTAQLPFLDPIEHFRRDDVNTGDLLVFDAILKQLEYNDVRNIQVAEGLESLKEPYEFDIAVLRGSNYITETIDLSYMIDTLKKIDTPIIPIGIGAQAPHYKKLNLHKGTIEALHIISDKCKTIGVRGNYSAEMLNDIGIKNIRVIGCPSFYRSTSPQIQIKKVQDPDGLTFGFTLNKYLWGEYASDWIKSLRLQRSLFLECINHRLSYLYSQGEREETLSTLVDGDEKEKQLTKIREQFDLPSTDEVNFFLSTQIYSPFTIDNWSDHVNRHIDFMVGFRLHGNIIALHQGIPSVYFTYDSRIRELTSLFGLPTIEVDEFRPINLRAIVEQSDFAPFEKCYQRNYKNYSAFLNENGLAHKLEKPANQDGYSPVIDVDNKIQISYDSLNGNIWIMSETEHLTKWINALDSERRNLLNEAKAKSQSAPALCRSVLRRIYNKILK